MSGIFILAAMVFAHILDDFVIQSSMMGKLKRRDFWVNHAKELGHPTKYSKDYIPALVVHSLSWAFMIMFPLAIIVDFNVGIAWLVALLVNAVIHGVTDDAKANRGRINLIQDQAIHFVQIIITFGVMVNL
jgi:hypothetical protein